MKNYRISIIMGVYNCEDTLKEAIDSLLAQTIQNWVLILCDDCSTDNTYQIAEAYRQQYPERMILLRNERNVGLNESLNRCLQEVKTEYVARMDGDDVSLPTRLEEELSFLDTHPEYAIVSTPMIRFDEHGDFYSGVGHGEPKLEAFVRGSPFCHAPCMIRFDAYQAVEGYAVSKDRLRVEDWDLWVRMYEKGYRGYVLEQPLYKMRDDLNAYKRRKFKYRLNEAKVIASAVKKLKLNPLSYVYCLRPIIVGLLPKPVYMFLHRL